MGRGKKLASKALKGAKRAGKKVVNDPEIRALVKTTASQLKRELIGGIKGSMTRLSGGKITGSGDYYSSSRNINGGRGIASSAMKVASSIVIEREELVKSIVSAPTAKDVTIDKFRVNPGNYITCPWGSAVASGYESWEPLSCQFVFKTTCGEMVSGTDNSLGKVAMAAQYNSFARDWDSFFEIENANDSVTQKPSESFALGVECKPSLRGAKTLYVSSTDPASAGKGFYDLCDVFVASSGCQGQNVRLGDLFIRYRWRLFNPIVRDSEFPTTGVGITGTVAAANDPFATTATVVENLSTKMGGSVVISSATVVTLNLRPLSGRLRINVMYVRSGTSVSRVAPTLAFAGTALGVPVTIPSDGSLVAGFLSGRTGASAAVTDTVCFNNQSVAVPVNTDTVTITAAACTGNAADVFKMIITLTPLESSDF